MRACTGALLALTAACGPMSPSDTLGDATSSTHGPSTTIVPTSTSEPATTSGPTTTDATTIGTGVTTTGDATSPSTDTTAGTALGGSSTGDPVGVQYRADFYIGQVNRITVYRIDFDADQCASITFAEGGSDPNPPITLPPNWQVEYAQVSQGVSFCLGGEPSLEWESAESLMGIADFNPTMPCDIDVDLTMSFPQTKPWVPAEIHFDATDLPIEGWC